MKVKTQDSSRFLKAPSGMRDILPSDQHCLQRIEKVISDLADFYNFNRIDTSVIEPTALFERAAGGEAGDFQKEIYFLKTKSGGSLNLRPEGRLSVARAYLEHNLGRTSQPQKLFYQGPVFKDVSRRGKRYRQNLEAGFEIIGGPSDPIYDAQIILLCDRILQNLKIKDLVLKINSAGCRICRPIYKRQLKNYYKRYEKDLCGACIGHLETNPLKVLFCDDKECEKLNNESPNFLDKLCVTCVAHLKSVLEYLDELEIPYTIENRLMLDHEFSNRTIFEFSLEKNEGNPAASPLSLSSGGRYDYLFELLGGRITPAVGAALSFEPILEVMKVQEVKLSMRNSKKVFLIHVGDFAKKKSLKLIEQLRVAGVPVYEALGKESMESQLKIADKQGMKLALIFGQKEIYEGSVIIRDLKTGLQETVVFSKMVAEIQKRSR
ncbi:MAG: histidine--tRNA ligase [Candidatus Liptonbacteria bacterium]|nr:histidine--tRNA ligase [Candidatus Liptonbacteria bacterium]